jgi:hypothetical protein
MMQIAVGDVFKRKNRTMRIVCTDMENDCDNSIVCLERSDVVNYELVAIHSAAEIETEGWTKVTPWDDFEMNEPVMVRGDAPTGWMKRHFAGISKDGKPMTWPAGQTSFTTEGPPCRWHQCRRPTEEERQR